VITLGKTYGYHVIVPDQKVTAGALDVVVATVVECVEMLVGADGGCVPAGTLTLKSVEIQRVRVLEGERVLPWGLH
jgi:hypothetical protein